MRCRCGCIRPKAASGSWRAETPAILILFDCLLDAAQPEPARRAAQRTPRGTGSHSCQAAKAMHSFRLSPYTRDASEAKKWLNRAGGALDGVVAKRHRRALCARRARDAEGQTPAHGRLRGRRLPLRAGQRARSARCCSASTMMKASSTMSASPRPSRTTSGRADQEAGSSCASRPASPATRPAARAAGAPSAPANGSRCAQAGRRSALRSRHRQSLPPRHQADALAARQVAASNAPSSSCSRKRGLRRWSRMCCAMSDPVFHGVTLSHPEKVLYPEQGITKRALAEYYDAVADWMLPHVVNRPISLVRCPAGPREEMLLPAPCRLGRAAAAERSADRRLRRRGSLPLYQERLRPDGAGADGRAGDASLGLARRQSHEAPIASSSISIPAQGLRSPMW